MQGVNFRRVFVDPSSNRTQGLILILLIVALVAAYTVYVGQTSRADALLKGAVTISQAALEETYGLRVSLIAVTAAGGLVDVRLKIIDGEKAKTLLKDSSSFPSLLIDKNVTLNVPQEVKEQEIQFEKNGNLFILFPNAGNAVRPGTQVRIMFGDVALEPLPAQ